MTVAQPQKKYNDLAESLTAMRGQQRFSAADDFAWRKLEREALQLRNVDPRSGWVILSMLYSTACNIEELTRVTSEARRYNLGIADKLNLTASNANAGLFTKALSLYRDFGAPETGVHAEFAKIAGTIGALQTFAAFNTQAEKMDISKKIPSLSILLDAANLNARLGLTDDEIARHLDLAGTVFRQHNLMPHYRFNLADMNGEFAGGTMVISVETTTNEVFDMNTELAELEIENEVMKISSFDVVFTVRTRQIFPFVANTI